MQKTLFHKLAAIGLITLLLTIPLWMIEGQIAGRSQRQAEVIESIAQSAAGQQTLIGPVLVVRYQRQVEVLSDDAAKSDGDKVIPRTRLVDEITVLAPQQLSINGQAQVETRQRGIFQGQLYHVGFNIEGKLEIPDQFMHPDGKQIIAPHAMLVMAVSDLRGVDNDPNVNINGNSYRLSTGRAVAGLEKQISGESMYVDFGPTMSNSAQLLDFSLPLSLTGTQALAIAPVGDSNHISLKSDWPHPNFGGRFLPRSHQIDEHGFQATWQISHLGRNFSRTLQASNGQAEALRIDWMQPVNIYLLAERAVKYGILFIGLTFGGFFVTEILRGAPIHPMQYLLVGLALAIFFLLLIALSEHISFTWSYVISATACIGLIGFYLAGALGGKLQGLAFGAGLTGLYGVLYGILHSEDNSLLMGSLLLFAALGGTMLGTRRLDWYGLNRTKSEDRYARQTEQA